MGAGPRRDKDSRCRNSLAPVPRRPGLQHVLGAGGLLEEGTVNHVANPVPPGPCCQAHEAPERKPPARGFPRTGGLLQTKQMGWIRSPSRPFSSPAAQPDYASTVPVFIIAT